MLLFVSAVQGAPFHLRFLDSATGFALQPQVTIRNAETTKTLAVDQSGRTTDDLPAGDYNLTIVAENHSAMSTALRVSEATPDLQFTLDPLEVPIEIRPQTVIAQHRVDASLFVGYVSGDDTGRALANVRIVSMPSGVQTTTDAQGYFKLYVPLQTDQEWATTPARLLFIRTDYQTEEHRNLELAPYGDRIMRITLAPGDGNRSFDEEGRRISPDPAPYQTFTFASKKDIPASNVVNPTNATVRLPTNIRVLLTNGTVDYMSMETYCKRSLDNEWIASWGGLNGTNGMNSLMAGSVANRSYAASYVRSTTNITYDICATTSCQVYSPNTAANTDLATDIAKGCVVISASGVIARSEYSAENNSIGFSCGDGYTEPGGCLYDPVCSGQTRFGHGRGMCQWGTARWATGFRMNGRVSGDSTPNGYPIKDWVWMVHHYYPDLTLVTAQPFIVGDDIRAMATVQVRACGDGSISSGTNCTLITMKTNSETGTIIAGPVQVTSDGCGYTWWKIQWSDNTIGWTPEGLLERVVPDVGAPSALAATPITTTRVDLSWTDTNGYEAGFKIERAYSSNGPWLQIKEAGVDVTSYSDTNVFAGNTYWYRVRAFNVNGNSAFSNKDSATTPAQAAVLASISNKTVNEGGTVSFTATATVSDAVQGLTDFEGFDMETATGTVLLRSPRFSGSTGTNINTAPDYSSITEIFPTNNGQGSRVLFLNFDVTNSITPWLRLTTSSAANIPNPVIDFTAKLRFDIYSSKSVFAGIGLRETTNAAGTIIGSDGGNGGGIEWVGVTNKNGNAPMPNRLVTASNWTTLTFDLPNERCTSFANGNGVLSTASGLGVFEHLAIVPNGGAGLHKVFVDNFAVVRPRTVSFSLDTGAPTNASIDVVSGAFSWTPAEGQGPGVYTIRVIGTSSGSPVARTTNSFTITVNEVNQAPTLSAVGNKTIHAGVILSVTNSATDADIPSNTLTYSLTNSPAGAAINSSSGVVTWATSDGLANTTNQFTIRVTDNGSPALTDSKTFSVTVRPRPTTQATTTTNGVVTLTWTAINGTSYKVQYKNDLNDADWTDLTTVTATSASASFNNSPGAQRFYRIVAL